MAKKEREVDPTQQRLEFFNGRELKEIGQAKVITNAGEEWRDAVLLIVRECARRFMEITADTVRVNCAEAGIPEPHHCNAWGSIFTLAAKDGIIVKAGRYEASKIDRSHSRALCVWRSCVYQQEGASS